MKHFILAWLGSFSVAPLTGFGQFLAMLLHSSSGGGEAAQHRLPEQSVVTNELVVLPEAVFRCSCVLLMSVAKTIGEGWGEQNRDWLSELFLNISSLPLPILPAHTISYQFSRFLLCNLYQYSLHCIHEMYLYKVGKHRALLSFYVYSSLDQLLISSLDQQKLQSVLSVVVPKCDVAAMLQEVKAEVKVKNTR